jgi:hypothetical protein
MVKCNKASFHILAQHSNQQSESKKFLALDIYHCAPLLSDICIRAKSCRFADALVMCLVSLSIYHS